MRNHKSLWQRAAFVFASFLCVCASGAGGQTLKEVTKFDLPGPGGKRFDYLTIDPDDHFLISAHLAADQTYVIDLATNKVIATIADTPGAEGVEYVSELKKFYTSNAHDNTIGVVDLQKMKVVKKLKTEANRTGALMPLPSTNSMCRTSAAKWKQSST
jgi:YVTN family beta-propeller protein